MDAHGNPTDPTDSHDHHDDVRPRATLWSAPWLLASALVRVMARELDAQLERTLLR